MVFGFDQTSYDAVLFVDRNTVIKEMLLAEFEAVLDGVVGEPEFADTSCHAAYIKIDRQLNIVGAVFFIIAFDGKGNADRRWNVPLKQLVETAAFGPKLNGVQVRIASHSQCQIPWHRQDLWEPDLSVETNTLKMLANSIQANRLGLIAEEISMEEPPLLSETVSDDGLSSGSQQQLSNIDGQLVEREREHSKLLEEHESREQERYKMAQNIKKQRSYIASLKSLHQQEMEAERIQFSKDRELFLIANKKLQEQLAAMENKYCEALLDSEKNSADLTTQQQDNEDRMSKLMDQHGVNHQELREQYRKDFQSKLIEQTSKIESQLEMREVEVYYREEQISRLKGEIVELKTHNERLQSQSVASEITSLVDNGVHFVVSKPGIGPMSIASKDLLSFISQPNAYLAERLGVKIEVYEAWLEHIKAPMCAGDLRSGSDCSTAIDTVTTPQEFVAGVSDRCAAHQQGGLSVANGN